MSNCSFHSHSILALVQAKWGEGDERWRVQDLGEGGRNVNSWHWLEVDATDWSRVRLSSLFHPGYSLVDPFNADAPEITVTSIKVEGEAVVNNRKKKIIAAYELSVTVDFTSSKQNVSGQIRMPYISEENHDEDPEVQIVTANEGPESQKVKDAIRSNLSKSIYPGIAIFVKELNEGGPLLTSSSSAPNPPLNDQSTASKPSNGRNTSSVMTTGTTTTGTGSATTGTDTGTTTNTGTVSTISTKAASAKKKDDGVRTSLRLEEKFYASARDIYECITDPRRIQAYTQSPAEISDSNKLSMFGGSIQIVFKEQQPPSTLNGGKLVMDWRLNNWEDGVYSNVEITIEEPDKGNVVLKLKQTGVPEIDKFGNGDVIGNVEAGWKERVFNRIRMVFGYGC